MMRKVEKELPEELKPLARKTATVLLPIGDSVYEMCPTGTEDFTFIRDHGADIIKEMKEKGGFSIEVLSRYLVERGLLNIILVDVMKIDPADAKNMTIAQSLYAAERWLHINFFCLPGDTMERILYATSFLESIFSPLLQSLPNMTTEKKEEANVVEMTPGK